MKTIICVLLFISLTACATDQAKQVDVGRMYYAEHHYRQAYHQLHRAAKAGDPDAQYAVAYMYYYGQGVVENQTAAHYWMEKAAKHGHKLAQKALLEIDQDKV